MVFVLPLLETAWVVPSPPSTTTSGSAAPTAAETMHNAQTPSDFAIANPRSQPSWEAEISKG
jgi:hypothetical protein